MLGLVLLTNQMAAAAGGVQQSTLIALTEAVGARVEAHAGASFEQLPEFVLAQSQSIARRGEPNESQATNDDPLGQHIGLYIASEHRVYLFEDNIQEFVAGTLGPLGLIEPYIVD